MRGYKKISIDACSQEKFEQKSYFRTMTVRESRLAFKIKYFLTPTVAMNFKNDKKFKSQNYLCQDCLLSSSTEGTKGYPNSQEHLMYECPPNEDIRRGKSLDQTHDLVKLFQEIIDRRQLKMNSG